MRSPSPLRQHGEGVGRRPHPACALNHGGSRHVPHSMQRRHACGCALKCGVPGSCHCSVPPAHSAPPPPPHPPHPASPPLPLTHTSTCTHIHKHMRACWLSRQGAGIKGGEPHPPSKAHSRSAVPGLSGGHACLARHPFSAFWLRSSVVSVLSSVKSRLAPNWGYDFTLISLGRAVFRWLAAARSTRVPVPCTPARRAHPTYPNERHSHPCPYMRARTFLNVLPQLSPQAHSIT